MYMYIHIYLYVYIYLSVSTYIYLYIYIYVQPLMPASPGPRCGPAEAQTPETGAEADRGKRGRDPEDFF